MAKKIPWVSKLRQIARTYSRLGERGRQGRGHALVAQYHANFQRLMDAADFDGVTWNVEFYSDFGATWKLAIDARFDRNDTRWMRAIKAVRDLATKKMECWHGDMRFRTRFGEINVIEVNVSTERIQIMFRNRNYVKAYCKTHRVREIGADKQCRQYHYTILTAQQQVVSLEHVLASIRKWA